MGDWGGPLICSFLMRLIQCEYSDKVIHANTRWPTLQLTA
uniref:Uncharacterized protein n=1 Tax=Anguilla anguilla TaxID=7936 RepID=A0A0E9SM83_ANGAN